jgi:outer membrane usher protein FimD/PapC
MSRSTPVWALLISTMLLLLTASAFAQFGASIQGTVTDKSGAVVSGANVTVTDQATGVSHGAVADASGFYRINELPPGKYRVDVQATSFKKSSRSDVEVSAEQPTPVNITMDTGSANETVTVTGALPALQTEDATIQGTITTAEVENLPEIDRDPYELLRLAP